MVLHDVIVVGAGPAGSRAGRLLAEEGCSVLLLEKEKLPRYKPCGGGLTHRALSESGLPPAGLIERWVYGSCCRLNDRLPPVMARTQEPSVAMVMRDHFDAALAEAARDVGALLVQGAKVEEIREEATEVRAHTTKGSFRGRFLVGADGAAGVVARSLGLTKKTQFHPAVEAELYPKEGKIDPSLETMAFYDLGAIPGGYGWIFPKAKHYSVGVCSTFSRIRSVMPYFKAFTASHPLLRECRPWKIKGWLIPSLTAGKCVANGRIILAGDAAGCVDPLSGEGISYALMSGRLAAEAIKKALSSDASLASYQANMEREIYSNLRWGKRFAKLYYAVPRLSYRMLLSDQRVVRHYFDLMAGRVDYRDLLRMAFRNWWRLRMHLPPASTK